MKSKWNVDPSLATTIARLISEIEGVTYILQCLDEPDELEYIENMKKNHINEYSMVCCRY